MLRVQKSPGGVESLVRMTAEADGHAVKVIIEREPGSSGKALANHYAITVLRGYLVEEAPATDGKITRAQPMLAAAEAGHVKLVKGGWNAKFISEFAEFPGGDHDDQVDNASIAYTALSGKKAYKSSWGRGPTSSLIGKPTTPTAANMSGGTVKVGQASWRV
jgi:predicted phage terminase large subunit-like protein